jgi:hypothetical protein
LESESWELSPLGSGESRGGEGNPLLIPIRFDERFNTSDLTVLPGEVWEVWLEYQDVFGRQFCAVHHKSPVRQEERLIPDPQAAGKFRYTPQPWVTFSEERDSNRWDRRRTPARSPRSASIS